TAQAVARLQTGHLEGEGRVGAAVGLGLVVGRHYRRLGIDGQRPGDVARRVVAVGVARADDAVAAGVAVRAAHAAAHTAQAVARLQTGHLEGEGRVGAAVGLGLVVGRHYRRLGIDGQRSGDVARRVVAVGVARADDAVGAGIAVRAAHAAAHTAQAVARLQTGHLEGEGRVGAAVGLGLVVGRHYRRLGIDGQRPGDVARRVVAVGVARADDAVGAGVAVRAAHAAAHTAQAVARLQTGHLEGEGRVGAAVGLGLVVGRHHRRLGIDGQRPGDVA